MHWASDQSFNFLQSPEDARALISRTGFREMSWITGQKLHAELEKHEKSSEDAPATGGLNPGLLNGPDGPRMGANVQRNIEEGRIVWAMGLVERI